MVPAENRRDSGLPRGGQFAIEQIVRLFVENSVVLDGGAALTLHALGLGRLAGIRSLRRFVPATVGEVSYEQVVDGTVVAGCKEARLSAHVSCGSTAIFDYAPEARVVTGLKSFHGAAAGPGMLVFDRRCLVLPFVFPNSPNTCILHTLRRELLTGSLQGLEQGARRSSIAAGGAYLAPWRFDLSGATVLLIANASTDDAQAPSVTLGGYENGNYDAEICASDGAVTTGSLGVERGQGRLPGAIRAMDVVAVRIAARRTA